MRTNFLATSSYFLSASSAINLAWANWASKTATLSSSMFVRFSRAFRIRSLSSAAWEASESLAVAEPKRSSERSKSSSSNWIRRFKAATSDSASSRLTTSSCKRLWNSSHSSLYFSISSLV
uniref:Putative secreted mucin n=1 Tax=Haematobia irritans TaxID=7368 RepID=A0A1L8EGX6_HAEIR